jgi:hypothetical protein
VARPDYSSPRPEYTQQGRNSASLPEYQARPEYQIQSRAGRHAPPPAGPLLLVSRLGSVRLGRDSAPRPGRLFSRPVSPDPPRLGLPAGWARWHGSPGWAGTCSPGWAASSNPAGLLPLTRLGRHSTPAGPSSPAPAGPLRASRPA